MQLISERTSIQVEKIERPTDIMTGPLLRNLNSPAVCPKWGSSRFFHITATRLSGHNKWSSIKHDKARNDSQKNKLFSQFAQRISVAVKQGGSADPNLNIRLATALEQAQKNNVTKKVIENAIRKGSGIPAPGEKPTESCIYEGIGPGGVAYVVEALTDNKNRTISLVRSAFNKAGGAMTPTLYCFQRRGFVNVLSPKGMDEEQVIMEILDIDGVQDYAEMQDAELNADEAQYGRPFVVLTEPSDANKVAQRLKESKFHVNDVGVEFNAQDPIGATLRPEDLKANDSLEGVLDDIEEITDIYTNRE